MLPQSRRLNLLPILFCGLSLFQIAFQKRLDFIEGDAVCAVIEIDVLRVVHHIQFLGFQGLGIGLLAEEPGVRPVAHHKQNGPWADLIQMAEQIEIDKGNIAGGGKGALIGAAAGGVTGAGVGGYMDLQAVTQCCCLPI